MRKWETMTALCAVIVASLGALPFHGRLYFTFAGMVMIAIVGLSRLCAAFGGRRKVAAFDAERRAQLIREKRRSGR